MTCDDVRLHLGGFVLAGLEPDEEERVAEHLADCTACRGEYGRLRGLPDLLAVVADAPPTPPSRLRERVLADAAVARAAARRRARRDRVLQLVAALLLGAVIGGASVWYQRAPAADSAVMVALEPVGEFDVSGSMELRPTPNGVAVELDLQDLPALGGDEVYETWFAPPGGPPLSVGTFRPDASGRARVTLSAAGPIQRYSSVWVTLEPDFSDPAHDGPTVVDAQL